MRKLAIAAFVIIAFGPALAWADDNNHVLLRHSYDGNQEYLLLNRSNPEQSQNLTTLLKLPLAGTELMLDHAQSDHFLVLNQSAHTLSMASLDAPVLKRILTQVLTFAADSSSSIVYITPDAADAHKVLTMYYDGSRTYAIRHDAASDSFVLAVDSFNGDTMLAIGDTQKNVGYVYRDPVGDINDPHLGVAVPTQAFTIKRPTYVSLSANGQYVVFEGGQKFAAYDADNQNAVVYAISDQLEAPKTHASWMDAARLYVVSHGQIVVFDYDGQNRQSLVSADAHYPLVFDDNDKFLYAFVQSADNGSQELLTRTPLRTASDQ